MIRRRRTRFGPARGTLVATLTLLALALGGCTDFAGYDLDYLLARAPFIATMRTSVAYGPNTLPRLPPPGTVPVASPTGDVPPPFSQAQLDSVGAVLTNPLNATSEVLQRGTTLYRNQCLVCHGADGQGNGPVVGNGRFPLGPTLVGGTAPARSDGYLYGIIRVGRGLMPAYGERIAHGDRWAVVHYVRELQRAAGATVPTAPPPPPSAQEPQAAAPPQ
ncbi:MAG: c-type cytochrome [Gemmatimonas sp.]|nr:c-type cytochrome [Gemmatimonas sp.]